MSIISAEIMKIIDERKSQNQTKKIKQRQERQKGTETIVKG